MIPSSALPLHRIYILRVTRALLDTLFFARIILPTPTHKGR